MNIFKKKAQSTNKEEEWLKLNKKVMELTNNNLLDEAICSAKNLLRFTKTHFIKHHKNTITSINNMGIIYMLKKDFKNSETYFLMAINICEKLGDNFNKELFVINTNLSKLYNEKAMEIKSILDKNVSI